MGWFWMVIRGKGYGRTTFPLLTAVVILALFLVGRTAASAPGTTLTVNTADDTDDGSCNIAHCSLREAINTANKLSGPETIQFSIPPTSTIKLTVNTQLPIITDTLTILGNDLTVSGNQNRVFQIGTGTAVTLTHLIIRDGYRTSGGAGIHNQGDLTIVESTITRNRGAWGPSTGGIYNASGTLTVIRSTISQNNADPNIGGIGNVSGVVVIDNSTISANQSSFGIGGIASQGGTVIINHSTLANNDSFEGPTDLLNYGTLYLSNSILETGCHNFGSLALSVASIARNGGCGATYSGDPGLGPRQNYGGPTETHPLLAGSPAIDNADPAYCPETDQRGVPRPDGAGCDIGSFEGFYSPTAVSLTEFDGGIEQRGWVWIVGVMTAVLIVVFGMATRRPTIPNF